MRTEAMTIEGDQDMITVTEITDRVKELAGKTVTPELETERKMLVTLLETISADNLDGGAELIHELYFVDYCISVASKATSAPYYVRESIDWHMVISDRRSRYNSVRFDGSLYYYAPAGVDTPL